MRLLMFCGGWMGSRVCCVAKHKPSQSKIKRLPKSRNGHRRVTVSFALWRYQKDTLRGIARGEHASMSYQLNIHLLSANWFRRER